MKKQLQHLVIKHDSVDLGPSGIHTSQNKYIQITLIKLSEMHKCFLEGPKTTETCCFLRNADAAFLTVARFEHLRAEHTTGGNFVPPAHSIYT